MPTRPQWFHRIPEILEELGGMEAAFVDRSVVEQVFGLRRRRAIYLIKDLGGYQVGKTFLVDRDQLMRRIQALQRGEGYEREIRRRTRLTEHLEKARKDLAARRVRIHLERNEQRALLKDLPPGIDLRPGELRIQFRGAEELLKRLFELAQAITNDYPRFQSLIDS